MVRLMLFWQRDGRQAFDDPFKLLSRYTFSGFSNFLVSIASQMIDIRFTIANASRMGPAQKVTVGAFLVRAGMM